MIDKKYLDKIFNSFRLSFTDTRFTKGKVNRLQGMLPCRIVYHF